MHAAQTFSKPFRLVFFAALALSFCGPGSAAPADETGDAALEQIEILTASGAHAFNVEVARTLRQRELGLMFRRSMPEDRGMLFFFDAERPIAMWMKNTYIPLDMVFVSRSGVVTGVARGAKPLSEEIIPSGRPAYAVVELNAGVADAIQLAVGDQVRHPGFKR